MESPQQLRPSLPGPMEHSRALSWIALLPFAPAVLVIGSILSDSPVHRWIWGLSVGTPVDRESISGGRRGHGLCLQRAHVEQSHVDKQQCGSRLDAMGRLDSKQ